jgi:hypothetical protein
MRGAEPVDYNLSGTFQFDDRGALSNVWKPECSSVRFSLRWLGVAIDALAAGRPVAPLRKPGTARSSCAGGRAKSLRPDTIGQWCGEIAWLEARTPCRANLDVNADWSPSRHAVDARNR